MADTPTAAQSAEHAAADQCTPAAGTERRVRPRYACGTVTLTRVSLTATDISYFAWVHDISEEGIGLDVLGPLAAGVDIVFDLERGGGNDAKMRLYAQVVHATPVGPFYRLGCRFTRPLRSWTLNNLLHQVRGHGQ